MKKQVVKKPKDPSTNFSALWYKKLATENRHRPPSVGIKDHFRPRRHWGNTFTNSCRWLRSHHFFLKFFLNFLLDLNWFFIHYFCIMHLELFRLWYNWWNYHDWPLAIHNVPSSKFMWKMEWHLGSSGNRSRWSVSSQVIGRINVTFRKFLKKSTCTFWVVAFFRWIQITFEVHTVT